MKKRNVVTLSILLLLLTCLIAVTLTACSDGVNGSNGSDGKSAYDIWLEEGYTGNKADFLEWLKGESGTNGSNGQNGVNGSDGKSAYQIWLDNGHSGSETDFLAWLKGSDGQNGVQGDKGQDGTNGSDGKSAYQIWLDNGHSGSEADFLAWLKGSDGLNGAQGDKGQDGTNGSDGKSAYQIWLDNGHSGSEADFLAWLKGSDGLNGAQGDKGETGDKGQDGANGLSAFEIFLKYYPDYTGTEEQWITDLLNGDLTEHKTHTITFKIDGMSDIKKKVFDGAALTNIPEVPEKIGNIGRWSTTDFSCVTEDMTVKAIYETQGLEYKVTIFNHIAVYRVSHGTMSEETEELYIPTTYQDNDDCLPVAIIDEYAFSNYSNLKQIHIPDSIIEIRTEAFSNCTGLTNIIIPNNVTKLGGSVFINCTNITTATISDNVDSFSDSFQGCSKLTSLTFNGGSFSERYLADYQQVETVFFKDKRGDGYILFWYADTERPSFSAKPIKEYFTNATIYFYSETEPTEEGNYWHYDTDGITPIIW